MFINFNTLLKSTFWVLIAIWFISLAFDSNIYFILASAALAGFWYASSSFFEYERQLERECYDKGYNAHIANSSLPSPHETINISTIDLQKIIRVNKLKDCTTAQKILSLQYHFHGKQYYAAPGDAFNHLSEITYAILKGDKKFYLCTTNHGALRGQPVAIHQRQIIFVHEQK